MLMEEKTILAVYTVKITAEGSTDKLIYVQENSRTRDIIVHSNITGRPALNDNTAFPTFLCFLNI